MSEEQEEEDRPQKTVVIRQKRNHANARNGVQLTKAEALAVVLIQERERRQGRGGGAGGSNSSAVGEEMNKIFQDEKYCDKNYVACFHHFDDNSITNSSSLWRNEAVQNGSFESAVYIIPTLFHNYIDFRSTWEDTPQRVRSRITETFAFGLESIHMSRFNAERCLKNSTLLQEFNLACMRARDARDQVEDIVDCDFLSSRGRQERQLSVGWILWRI